MMTERNKMLLRLFLHRFVTVSAMTKFSVAPTYETELLRKEIEKGHISKDNKNRSKKEVKVKGQNKTLVKNEAVCSITPAGVKFLMNNYPDSFTELFLSEDVENCCVIKNIANRGAWETSVIKTNDIAALALAAGAYIQLVPEYPAYSTGSFSDEKKRSQVQTEGHVR